MFENIEQAADALANKNAGWVVRRDGASNLGYAAGKALAALKAYEDEKDVDVRRAIDKALGEASNALAGVPPRFPESRKHTLEELVRACEKPGKREVKPHDDGFLITVALGERRQTVYVMPLKRKDGMELIRIYTFCGPLDEKTGMWALKTNPKLVQCAFAVLDKNGQEQLALTNCYLAADVTPREIQVAVKEIAHYGDWLENRLTGEDTL